MPWQVKNIYKSQLSDGNFPKTKLIQTAQQWKMKKIGKGNFFILNSENTSVAHLKRWTNEYLNETFYILYKVYTLAYIGDLILPKFDDSLLRKIDDCKLLLT